METITVNGTDFLPFSEPNALRDPALWRAQVVGIPAMLQPIMQHTAVENRSKTNINETILVAVPIVQTIDGISTAPNKVVASAQFTCLQNVVADDSLALALDGLIALLTARREAILAGKTK